MKKSELINVLSARCGLSKADSDKAINSFINIIQEAITKEKTLTLVGFGTFSVKDTAARRGRNFKTGKSIRIPPRKSVKFKPGKTLKNYVLSSK